MPPLVRNAPRALPLHLQVGQTSDVESRIAMPVRISATWKYVGTPLNTLERKPEFFSNAAARLITVRVREPDAPHSERTKGITKQGVCCLGCKPLPLGALAHPEPGVALATLPVDVMKATPDDCCTGRSLEPNQLYAFTQDKASHYLPISDFH